MITKFTYGKRRQASHLLETLGPAVIPEMREALSSKLKPRHLAKADDREIVGLIADLTGGLIHVSVPEREIAFANIRELLASDPDPAVLHDVLSKGIWEYWAGKSQYDIEEFEGPFVVRFDWNGPHEIHIAHKDITTIDGKEGRWYYMQKAGKTKGGLPLSFEVRGVYDIFCNLRTSGPCLTVTGEGTASCCVFVHIDGQVSERIDDVDVCEEDITLDEIVAYTDAQVEYQRRCRKQFIRNLRDWLKSHPDTVKINIDPDCGFCVEQTHKHYDTIAATVLAVGVDKDGDLFFDTETEYDYDKTVYLADVAGYGVVVTDWEWALRYLLEHFKDPYEPEDYDDDIEEDEDKTSEDGRI